MALYLGSSGKQAVLCDGEKYTTNFYNSSKFYAYWNTYKDSYSIGITFGGAKKYKIYPKNTNANSNIMALNYVGNTSTINTQAYLTPVLCEIDETMKTVSDAKLTTGSLYAVQNYLGINSFKECKSVTYCFRFKQTNYDGDIILRPFMIFPVNNDGSGGIRNTNVTGSNIGINNYMSLNTSNGFTVNCLASYKGKTVFWRRALDDTALNRLDNFCSLACYPRPLCKMFRADDETTEISGITAYFGGYLVFEM